jgi:two-component system chemotaxis sensor kinase CheA
MASVTIPVCLKQLAGSIGGWTSGDLLAYTAIEAQCRDMAAHPELPNLDSSIQKALKALASSVRDLLSAKAEAAWLERARGLISSAGIEMPEAGRDAGPSAAPSAPDGTGGVPAPREAGALYEPGYFANIIEDRKMLGQLCDEVHEHLETAQFTLVDLEYDSSNPENINKIFRAFHTIKSSAAFLGLKNIEETAHSMEDLLVMLRDGKIQVSAELIDVVFYGIGLLKDLILIIETSDYSIPSMIDSFNRVDNRPYIAIIRKILENHSAKRIGEILQESGTLDSQTVAAILAKQQDTKKKFGEIAIEEHLVSEEDFRAALHKQNSGAHKASYVRVSNERLNGLIDIVGELVVNQSMLRQYLTNPDSARETAERTVSQLESITTSIKNLVLSMGMVPIAEIFNKLRVVIRNTAAETGKTVNVEFFGDDTELDRNVIESIYDPLVHIVRNAVDHGLESPEGRDAAGKPRLGKIQIAAEHKGNGIEISVSDDGRGIDRERIIEKGIAQGLITEEQSRAMSDKDVQFLLFLPGFSTAERVTEVSGRGVGLDVVKKNIEQIHGKVEIVSEPGKGSSFVIRIPLTLAIIDGFVTEVDGTKYIFPFNLIEEIIVPASSDLTRLDNGRTMLLNRGNYIPIVFAREVFDRQASGGGAVKLAEQSLDSMLIIVISYEHRRYGIAVNSVVGKQEIVIKSLNEALYRMKVFSGGTIFGDGSIGFVVDVEEFIECAREEE